MIILEPVEKFDWYWQVFFFARTSRGLKNYWNFYVLRVWVVYLFSSKVIKTNDRLVDAFFFL